MPGSRFCVCALNALQNSMMLSPRWPSAGPIGGDGLALPAGTCSLIKPTTFFAMSCPQFRVRGRGPGWPPATNDPNASNLFDLRILQLHRGGAAEDRNRDFEPGLLLIDLLDETIKRGERPIRNAHLLADLEGDRRFRPLDALLDLAHDARGFGFADRRRAQAASAEEAGDLRRVLDEVPSLVGEIHLDQHVTREELAFGIDLGATLDLDDFLGGNQDFLELAGESLLLGLLADRTRDLLLEA